VQAAHERAPLEDYNNELKYRSMVTEMSEVKMTAMSKLAEWLENPGSSLRFRFNAPLRTVHRRYVFFLEKQRASAEGEIKVKASKKLCRLLGLIVEDVTETNELGETRLVTAAAEGRPASVLRLLVDAQARVDEPGTKTGATPLDRVSV
jgi:hypothetical protein